MADKLTLDRQAMKDRSTSHLRIYVGGLTENATVDELYEHFIEYGQINGIVVNRNFGFVQFETEASAKRAITSANGSVFQGKNINVRASQTNIDKPRHTEVVVVQSDIPPAVALTDNIPESNDAGDDLYDSYGNYIGDDNNSNNYNNREEDYEDTYSNQSWGERGGMRGRGRGGRGRAAGRGRRGPDREGFRDRSPPPPRDESDASADPEPDAESASASESAPTRARRRRCRPLVRRRSRKTGAGTQVTLPTDDFRRRGQDWGEKRGFDRERYAPPPEYPRPVPVSERNDCEIIVVSKSLTEYAEYIEGRLKRLGIVVDLLFPMEDVPIGKVLGNIASRGCLYAILVMPLNQENRSLTLTILHGLPQEHRNMPLEDALQLLSRNFQEVQRGGPSGREAVYALLGQLADGRSLTVLQYEKVIEYLQERKEQQVKIELGEPLTTAPGNNKTETELQQRILSILNDKKAAAEPTPAAAAPASQNKLLNDPTVRKALDSILQKFT